MPLLYKIACSVVKGCCATVVMVRCAMMMPMSIHHITSQLSGACRPGCTNRSWLSHDCGTGAISTVAPCHCNAVASVAAGRLLHCWTLHPSGEIAKHCYRSANTECSRRTFTCAYMSHDQMCTQSVFTQSKTCSLLAGTAATSLQVSCRTKSALQQCHYVCMSIGLPYKASQSHVVCRAASTRQPLQLLIVSGHSLPTIPISDQLRSPRALPPAYKLSYFSRRFI